jgi:hypothetical protein
MGKLDYCDALGAWCCQRCEYFAHSPYVICGVHPYEVKGNRCPDFSLATRAIVASDDPLAWYEDEWRPEGASYYGGELVLEPVQRLTLHQRLELIDTHPLFTGRCPQCERPIVVSKSEQVHWECENCDWTDDSL